MSSKGHFDIQKAVIDNKCINTEINTNTIDTKNIQNNFIKPSRECREKKGPKTWGHPVASTAGNKPNYIKIK